MWPQLIFGLFICLHCGDVYSYTQIALSGVQSGSEGPRIYKALNTDLLFPKVFNSSENVVSTTEQTPSTTTTQFSSTTATFLNNHKSEEQEQSAAYVQHQASLPIFVTPANVPAQQLAAIPNNQQQYIQQNYAHAAPAQRNQQQVPAKDEVLEHFKQQQQPARAEQVASTGRAVDYNTKYPFGQLITPLMRNKPVQRPPAYSNRYKYNYPTVQTYRRPPNRAEIDKLRGKTKFSDRFTPSEAVASAQFGKNKNNNDHHDHYNHQEHDHSKTPASTNVVQSYAPPTNLYSFPPNVDAQYPAPAQDPKAKIPSSSISSYLPPPSGTFSNSAGYPLATASSNDNGYKYAAPEAPKDEGYKYNPPISSYLPPAAAQGMNVDNNSAMGNDNSGSDADNGDDTIGVLPASAQDTAKPSDSEANHDHVHDHIPSDYDPNKVYPTPPPGWMEEQPDPEHDHDHNHDHDHDHAHDHSHADDHHEHEHHAHHDDHHDHDSYVPFPSYDNIPLIYDDHHFHHHVEPETTTPEPPPPPPEPAPEPRVKKYSYFYIGRKLWYIPLYFTVWFSFYVLWLILKSIARHKVNLPNHYVNRRSVQDYTPHKNIENLNQMTVRVLNMIDDFKKKYVT